MNEMKKLIRALDRLLFAARCLSNSISRSTKRLQASGDEMEAELARLRKPIAEERGV